MNIYKQGKIEIEDNIPKEFHKEALEALIHKLVKNVNEVIICKEVKNITHYWLLADGRRSLAYFGTEESFNRYQNKCN